MYKMKAETAEHMEFIQQLSGAYMVDIHSAIEIFELFYYESNPLRLINDIKEVRKERNKSQRFMTKEMRSKGIDPFDADPATEFEASFDFVQHFERRCKYNLAFAVLVKTLNEFGVNVDHVSDEEELWHFGENNNFDAFESMDFMQLPGGTVIGSASPEDMKKLRKPKKKSRNKKKIRRKK